MDKMSPNEEQCNDFYEKRPGANDWSKYYRILMSALCALKFCLDDTVEDFELIPFKETKISTTLSIQIIFKNKSKQVLLIHLRYKENMKRNLTDAQLQQSTGNFSLSSFYKNSTDFNDNTHSIVYTNLSYSSDAAFLEIPEKVSLIKDASPNSYFLLNTSGERGGCHKFVNTKNEKLFFLTNQATVDKLEEIVIDILKIDIGGNIFANFIYFMEQCTINKIVLNKHHIIAKITELAFDSYMQIPSSASSEKNKSKILLVEKAMMSFDLTVVKEDTVCKLWAKGLKEIANRTDSDIIQKYFPSSGKTPKLSDLPEKSQYKALWFMNELPLIVKINKQNENVCKNVIKLFQKQTGDKTIIFIGEISKKELDFQGKFFGNLSDLSDRNILEEILATFDISLQGRYILHLNLLVNADLDILKCITPNELVKMSLEELVVGTKIVKELPQFYINREISTKIETTEKNICKNEERENENIFKNEDSCLKVLIAPPGEGKSTTLLYLNNNCPSQFWSNYVNLRNFIQLFKEKSSTDKVLSTFLELKEDRLIYKIRNILKHKIHLFLDGLDEIDSDCFHYLFHFIKQILWEGVRVWLTSRENLKEIIFQEFEVISVVMAPVHTNQQKLYIEQRLSDSFNADEIKTIISAVYANIDLIIKEDVLNNVLHLHILTKSFLDNYSLYKNIQRQGFFLLNKMFRLFLEGKKEILLFKTTKAEEIETQIGYVYSTHLKHYEIPALKSLLDIEDFQKIDLNLTDSFVFLRPMVSEGDKFGIIKTVKLMNMEKEDYEVEFVFRSYAKYFACMWFKEQKNQNSELKNNILLQPKYSKLKNFLDVIVANKRLKTLNIYSEIKQRVEKV